MEFTALDILKWYDTCYIKKLYILFFKCTSWTAKFIKRYIQKLRDWIVNHFLEWMDAELVGLGRTCYQLGVGDSHINLSFFGWQSLEATMKNYI